MKLATIFTDGAVLQRRVIIPIWGSNAAPQSLLQATLGSATTYAQSSVQGEFCFQFSPQEAGGPWNLTVTELSSGQTLKLSDIYIGEVWLASGQSNMEYSLGSRWDKNRPNLPEPVNQLADQQEAEFSTRIKAGQYQNFHFISLSRCATGAPETTTPAVWQTMPEKFSEASAVAAWFGLEVRDYLNVPMGLVISDWGGSIVEAWTSTPGLLQNPDTREMILNYIKIRGDRDQWTSSPAVRRQHQLENLCPADTENRGVKAHWAEPDFDDSAWADFTLPGSWIGQKLSGNGEIWVRRAVDLPVSWAGLDLQLNLPGVDKMDISYFNGVEIGHTGQNFDDQYYNVARHYPIPGKLVKNGRNVIAIRARSFVFDGSFNGPIAEFTLENCASGATLPIAGTWKFQAERNLGRQTLYDNSPLWGPEFCNTPTILFDGMIRPILPYPVRGVIWYQGESNATTRESAELYASKMAALVRDWRQHWGNPNLPFLQVELANFFVPHDFDAQAVWPILREAQHRATKLDKNIFLTTAIDVGDAEDIHPQNKKTVGHRLAQLALHQIYGATALPCSGPRWLTGQADGASFKLSFEHAENLHLTAPASRAFFLAGSDRVFYPATQASIANNVLTLSCPEVPTPVAVRYAWSNNPESILYNAADLPASPFRTDAWPSATVKPGK